MHKTQIVVTFQSLKEDDTDILIAFLADICFDGFDESDDTLKAYISKDSYEETILTEIAERFSASFEAEEVASQNWNAVWESNFEPVIIEDFVVVRAHFHEKIPFVQHEIIITPKMSFGTGHHATTTMMIQQMRNLDFAGKTVLDFGTGTGILSILAEKLGATHILAIDNDEWSIENSKENIGQNSCSNISVELKNDANAGNVYDVIVANINRNVIVDNLVFLSSQLPAGGFLLLSGLLADDENLILEEAGRHQLLHINTCHRFQWISLLFSR